MNTNTIKASALASVIAVACLVITTGALPVHLPGGGIGPLSRTCTTAPTIVSYMGSISCGSSPWSVQVTNVIYAAPSSSNSIASLIGVYYGSNFVTSAKIFNYSSALFCYKKYCLTVHIGSALPTTHFNTAWSQVSLSGTYP